MMQRKREPSTGEMSSTRRRSRLSRDEESRRGPWINVAAVCERFLEEKDNVLTLVRVVDQVAVSLYGITADGQRVPLEPGQVPNEVMEQLPTPPTRLALVVMLRGAGPGQRAQVRVDTEDPQGQRRLVSEEDVSFAAPTGGYNLLVRMDLVFTHPGVHWFDIFCDGRLLSRIPLEVVFPPIQGTQAPNASVSE